MFKDNSEKLAQVLPLFNDPLYQVLEKMKGDLKLLLKSDKEDRLNFKLKTRLLIEDENPVASRC